MNYKLLLALAVPAILVSCKMFKKPEPVVEKPKPVIIDYVEFPIVEKIKSLVIGDPFDCGLDDMIVFPIGTNYLPEKPQEIENPFMNSLTTINTPTIDITALTSSSFGFTSNASTYVTPYTWSFGAADTVHLMDGTFTTSTTTTTTTSSSSSSSSSTYRQRQSQYDYIASVPDVVSGSAGKMHDRFATREFINNNADNDITNLLFYDMTTGESYPLFEDTLHILSFAIHQEFEKDLIIYRVVKNDYNEDSLYDERDPVMLYVSDLDGSDMVRITDEKHQFVNYNYYPKFDRILIKTRIDSDGDFEFTKYDETNFTELNLLEPGFGREIFSPDLKGMLYDQIGFNQD